MFASMAICVLLNVCVGWGNQLAGVLRGVGEGRGDERKKEREICIVLVFPGDANIGPLFIVSMLYFLSRRYGHPFVSVSRLSLWL